MKAALMRDPVPGRPPGDLMNAICLPWVLGCGIIGFYREMYQ
jgi:hypothetical protein